MVVCVRGQLPLRLSAREIKVRYRKDGSGDSTSFFFFLEYTKKLYIIIIKKESIIIQTIYECPMMEP